MAHSYGYKSSRNKNRSCILTTSLQMRNSSGVGKEIGNRHAVRGAGCEIGLYFKILIFRNIFHQFIRSLITSLINKSVL